MITPRRPRLIAVRHGDTSLNQQKRMRGTMDIPLDEDGYFQAEHLGQLLYSIPIDVIFTSPLQRAKQTAYAIREYQYEYTGEEAKIYKELKPWTLGELNGKKAREAETKLIWLMEHPDEYPPLSNETFNKFLQRSVGCWRNLLDATYIGSRTICAVTHLRNVEVLNGWFKAGLGDKIDTTPIKDNIDVVTTGGIYILEYISGKWELTMGGQ